MWISLLIGGIIVIFGIYMLVTSIKKEVTDGCYACPSKNSCSRKSCSAVDIADFTDKEKK